jgi:hypothetical protein
LNEAPDTGDETKIRAAGKAAGEALTKQALYRAAIAKNVKAILTAEQLDKLPQVRTRMAERMIQQQQQGAQEKQSPSSRQSPKQEQK